MGLNVLSECRGHVCCVIQQGWRATVLANTMLRGGGGDKGPQGAIGHGDRASLEYFRTKGGGGGARSLAPLPQTPSPLSPPLQIGKVQAGPDVKVFLLIVAQLGTLCLRWGHPQSLSPSLLICVVCPCIFCSLALIDGKMLFSSTCSPGNGKARNSALLSCFSAPIIARREMLRWMPGMQHRRQRPA